jgi:ElaB/YqjD/DUF883 family membrane-anchored ribosome-binding protein
MTDIAHTAHSSEDTIAELRDLLREAENVLAETGDAAGGKVEQLRDRLRAALAEGRSVADRLREAARHQAEELDTRVREHPYESIGIAVGVGALLGLVVSHWFR